MRRQRPYDKSH